MRFTLDSNILVYALDAATPRKRAVARDILDRAKLLDAVLTTQAVAEFLAVVRRKDVKAFPLALAEAERWAVLFPIGPTTWDQLGEAAAMADRHRLQLWDCLIWRSALAMGATVFISEDMRDGFSLDGMTVLDPFAAANATPLADLLAQPAEPS